MTWEELEKKLEYFLDSHDMPNGEKKQVIATYKKGYREEENCDFHFYNFFKCIDYGLGWNSCERGFDYYYFLQLRWLDFLINHVPEDKRLDCIHTLKEIISYAGEAPKWKSFGNNPNTVLLKRPTFFIISEHKFNNLKKFYENKAKRLIREAKKIPPRGDK